MRRDHPDPWIPLMPRSLELAEPRPSPARRPILDDLDADEVGYNYVCRRCDVWGRVPAGVGRRCWACERTDRLERR